METWSPGPRIYPDEISSDLNSLIVAQLLEGASGAETPGILKQYYRKNWP